VIQKIAFLLISIILISAGGFAAPPEVFPGGAYTGYRNANIDLNGYATNANGTITSIRWDSLPTGCSIVDEFVYVEGDQNKNDAVITCIDIVTGNVSLKADNNYGESRTENAQLAISNQAPTVDLLEDATTGTAPFTVTFTGFCSDPDGNGTINTCFLDYDDGEGEAISGPPYDFTKSHEYSAEGTYYPKLMANDDQDINMPDTDEITVTLASDSAPTINNKSPSPGSTTSEARPTVSFDVNDAGDGVNISSLALFVDGSHVSPSKTSEDGGNSYHASWTFGSNLSNNHTVKVGLSVKSNSGTSTGDVNWQFSIDTQAPALDDISVDDYTDDSTPSISVQGVSGNPSQMALSCNGSDWKAWQAYSATITNFSITSSNYGCLDGDEGSVTIYLKLRDAMENESDQENDSTVYDNSNPDTPSLDSANPYDEEVELNWEGVSDNGPSGIKEYIIYKNGSQIGTTSNTHYTVGNLNNGTEYDFKIRARDRAGNTSGYSNILEATPRSGGGTAGTDSTPPYLRWEQPTSNKRDNLSGIVTLKVWCYDDESILHPIRFYVDGGNLQIGSDGSSVDERYSIAWDSTTVADGTHTLKALAKNRSGNEGDDITIETITVTTNNGIENLPGDENGLDAQKAINAADDAKEDAARVFEDFGLIGVSPSSQATALLKEADGLLKESQDLFDDREYDSAEEKALESKEKLDEIAGIMSIEDYGSESKYIYNEEHLKTILTGMGFSQQLSEEADELMKKFTINRTLAVKKVSNAGNVYYKAIVTIGVRNNSSTIGATEGEKVKVLEVIPKEFAENASAILADGFSVIVEDPVLQWEFELGSGENAEITYVLKENLDYAKADQLLDQGMLDKFIVPPILVKAETEVGGESFSGAAAGVGLFGLGFGVELVGWIVLIVIVIAAVVLAFNYLRGREGESQFGLGAAAKGSGPGFFDKFSGIGRRKEDEPGRPKWAYKG